MKLNLRKPIEMVRLVQTSLKSIIPEFRDYLSNCIKNDPFFIPKLTFTSSCHIPPNTILGYVDIFRYGLVFFDWFIYNNLPDQIKLTIEWTVVPSNRVLSESEINISLLFLWTSLVFYDKTTFTDG